MQVSVAASSSVDGVPSSPSPDEFQLRELLSQSQKRTLDEEKRVLFQLSHQLRDAGMSGDDRQLLSTSIQGLDDLFLVTVVGEFNSGKSTLINALLGDRYCLQGVTPTTSTINIIRYGPAFEEIDGGDQTTTLTPTPSVVPSSSPSSATIPASSGFVSRPGHMRLVTVPVAWLKYTNLVDTPGTNAIIEGHQALTENFIPRSDLIMFTTSVDRPFSESEKSFLSRILAWKKHIIIVLNKFDTLLESDGGEQDQQQVLSFVINNVKTMLDDECKVFPVSARLALRAKLKLKQSAGLPTLSSPSSSSSSSSSSSAAAPAFPSTPAELRASAQHDWALSRFDTIESHLLRTLDDAHKIQLKLENPLGIADRLLTKYKQLLVSQQNGLADDLSTLKNIEAQLDAYKADMQSDFAHQRAKIDNVLWRMIDRVDLFLTNKLRLSNTFQLLKGSELQSAFEKEVVADFATEIERYVGSLVDWLIEKNTRQCQAVAEYMARNISLHQDKLLGRVSSTPDLKSNRELLVATLQRNARDVMMTYDRHKESDKLRLAVRSALLSTAMVEVGAVGLGAMFAAALLDVSGLAGAGVVAVSGLLILPYKRKQIKQSLRSQINALQVQLQQTLNVHFDAELDASVRNIHQFMEPYSRFVRVENSRLSSLQSSLSDTTKQLLHVRHLIKAATMPPSPAAAHPATTNATATTLGAIAGASSSSTPPSSGNI